MELKRLIIKNFGDIKELEYVPNEIANSVSETVASAISYVLNNQFAIRHYNRTDLRDDTYLFGEIYFYKNGKKDVYTTEIKGLDNPVFTKNGVRMTDDEVDSDQILSRPYREDNTCIFSARSTSEFLDYGKFLPTYFSRLTGYSISFNATIGSRLFLCDPRKDYEMSIYNGNMTLWRKKGGKRIGRVNDLSECDKTNAKYLVFTLLLQMIDYHQQCVCQGREITRTPIIVDGLISGLDEDPSNLRFLLTKTTKTARQAFFVEKSPKLVDRYVKNILK